ncbi:MAG: tRNA (adenosine(37)-N6)-threonylcarbamoyltransferase complex ATPase subunit type 1 TsaE [Myxococcales bacterium]|nr:tRNA (adenosine(37)-N6)-threonylcarbamoyltransferase complex ATPase subunit type 1 TsaE [Myxococcales bacterium]
MERASHGPEATAALGRALAQAVDPDAGLFVALIGPLGAGKTVFVKGAAAGLGIDPDQVASPTFVLANRHDGPAGGHDGPADGNDVPGGAGRARTLVHADLYRIESEPELLAAGFLDWLEPGALVIAEWGDRFPDALPQDRLELRIARLGECERSLQARALGPISQAALARWEAAAPA